ncbi:MAG: cation acetate symporter [Sciscionella sp.]
MQRNVWAIAAVALLIAVSFYLGARSSRSANSTPDFLLARRRVRSRRNAAAISGEYLSAASFLGIAGLILKQGAGALWYPVGFTAGYLALLLFVAAPLRRSGAYTVPDFVEARLGSPGLRNLSTVVAILIGFLYLVPQLQGAGLALSEILPVPIWVGAVLVMLVVLINVLGGGMRAATTVQAFQYWIKLFAIAAPTFVFCAVFLTGGSLHTQRLSAPSGPRFSSATTITMPATEQLQVSAPTRLRADGMVDHAPTNGGVFWAPPGDHTVGKGTTLSFAAGAGVPVVAGAPVKNSTWLRPGPGASDLLDNYSLLFALFAGTMGLPHVLVRFYTNPDGRAARRTTLHVLVLLGLFYLFPTILGALSRLYVPELLVTGKTDAAVLLLPSRLLGGLAGQIVGAVLAAGAFAAFLSTCSGLLVSLAGVFSTDALSGRVRDFKFAAVLTGAVPLALALLLRPGDISTAVGMAFALAASTFCPVLVLGIWWRKLTWVGAACSMVAGGGLVIAALTLNVVSVYTGGWAPALLLQPALVTVPVAFLVAIGVSKGTKGRVPADLNNIFLRLHAPDPLGFTADRDVARFGALGERSAQARGRHRRG